MTWTSNSFDLPRAGQFSRLKIGLGGAATRSRSVGGEGLRADRREGARLVFAGDGFQHGGELTVGRLAGEAAAAFGLAQKGVVAHGKSPTRMVIKEH